MNNLTEEDHNTRSNFVRELIQDSNEVSVASSVLSRNIPKKIVQFWDNLNNLPDDVRECIETWKKTEGHGIERLLFDNSLARDFIYQKLGSRYVCAYDKCYHPAMQSDYFRLCYIFVEGGCYIDADDEYNNFQIQHLFNDGRLKIQPLCYDKATNRMVPPTLFIKQGANDANWIFYFNNNPLIAGRGHPIIKHALDQATLKLEVQVVNDLPEIQSTTGPGNLTKSIFDAVILNREIKNTLLVLYNWEELAKNRWDLSYRNDSRNWRLSNSINYSER